MYDWIFEGRLAVYLTLAALAIVLLGAWWSTRRGVWLGWVAVVLAAAGIYYLLDRLVLTDHEQVEQAVRTMADGIGTRNTQTVMSQLSEQFRRDSLDREGLRQLVEHALQHGWVEGVTVKNFEFLPAPAATNSDSGGSRASGPIRVSFSGVAWGGTGGEHPYRCEADFIRVPDGKWRMATFQLFDPISDSSHPMEIHGLHP